jgi:uncharacterized protein (TIGR02466 family)
MKETNIQGLFPTPIYFSKLNRNLSKKELTFIEKTKLNTYKNEGNTTSNDTYILNNEIFKNLKKELDLTIKDYFNKIICPLDNIVPYITQSWLNYTETEQFHHKHKHPNSLVSGVFYINSDEKFDKITFFNDKQNIIQPEIKNWNIWNATSWWFPVKTKDVILFPSSLIHMVETKKGNNTRISLAFNVFIKGTIGNNKKLTELKL